MLVKRYVVKEVPEALALIRQDLGADAMILSTKKIQTRRFFGIFTKDQIEVVAASADPVDTKTDGESQQSRGTNSSSPRTRIPSVPPVQASQSANTTPSFIDLLTPDADEERKPYDRLGSYRQERPFVQSKSQDNVKQASFDSQDKPVEQGAQDSYQDVIGEIKRLRKMVNRIADSQDHLPKPLLAIRQILTQQEIDSERLDEVLEQLHDRMEDQTWDLSKARFETEQIFFDEMQQWKQDATIAPSTRIAAFVGATGVGKTTTIAKIAAEQVMKHRKKIALITTDTYRIAAVEQLRTYANILNIPIEVAFTPQDYNKAIESFKNYDLVLVDTAGRNYHDPKFVEEISTYFELHRPDEIYLALSTTAKVSDSYKMIDNFLKLKIDKFLFTKLDETASYGFIYNVLRQFQKPFSYVTDGQDVPDNLSCLSTRKLVNLLIGENSYV